MPMNGKWSGETAWVEVETEMEIDTTKYSTSSKLIHTSPDRTTYSIRTGINRPSACFLVFVVSIVSPLIFLAAHGESWF